MTHIPVSKAAIIALSIYCSFFMQSCDTKPASTTENATTTKPAVADGSPAKIFADLVHIQPIYCVTASIDNKECIVAVANKEGIGENGNNMFYSDPEIAVYKLARVGDAWKIEAQRTVIKDSFTYYEFHNDFELVHIGNQQHLFFTYTVSPMGNAVFTKDLYFALYSFPDAGLTTLQYSGEPHDDKTEAIEIEEDAEKNDIQKGNPELLNYLKDKAATSALIYRPTAKDRDLNDPDNYDKRWMNDNSNIKDVWSVRKNTKEAPLKTTYYDKDLFQGEHGSVTDSIENGRYKVVSFFRNDVLGYDKLKRKYFPIWVEGCSHGCDKGISFLNNTTLEITYTEAQEQTIVVDLEKMTYKIVLNEG